MPHPLTLVKGQAKQAAQGPYAIRQQPLSGADRVTVQSQIGQDGEGREQLAAPCDLDPVDWPGFRAQAHRMMDDILDYLQTIRQRPVWQPMPANVRGGFRTDIPRRPADLDQVHQEFLRDILPYTVGNVHPRFFGWVHGGGTPVGVVAEMLAAGLNANLGGRDHAPIAVERQILHWVREIFGFPRTASGLFVTGSSMANLLAILVARDAALGICDGASARQTGLAAQPKRLTAYACVTTHGCVGRALDICGLGTQALRLIPADSSHRIDLGLLRAAIHADRAAGSTPFLVVGNAGTVDTGAIDPLLDLANICERESLWFHIDGAFGALAQLAPELAARLSGMERADSLAFDFHKWGQVPYDAGFLMVRDGETHQAAFGSAAAYLERSDRGLAAGSPWPCDFGVDLSRGFRALKTWFTLKVHGTEALGAAISRSCRLAQHLAARIAGNPELELLAPVTLNIVCFRYRGQQGAPTGSLHPIDERQERRVRSANLDANLDPSPDQNPDRDPDPALDRELDRLNQAIVVDLQESGIAAPSTTRLPRATPGRAQTHTRLAIRAALFNHRTQQGDVDALYDAVLAAGRRLSLATASVPSAAGMRTPSDSAKTMPEASLKTTSQSMPSPAPALATRPEALPPQLQLDRIDSQLRATPDSIPLLFVRACLLEHLGRVPEAQAAYVRVLQIDGNHLGALNNLGNLCFSGSSLEHAHALYAHAVATHPNDPMSRANLGNLCLRLGEANPGLVEAARRHFEHALSIDPAFRPAHAGLSLLLGEPHGAQPADAHQAEFHRRAAFAGQAIIPLPYRGQQPAIPILELVSATTGNAHFRNYLPDRIYQTSLIATEFYNPQIALPPHQLIVNAIGDADIAPQALAQAELLLERSSAPVVNHPSAVRRTGRCAMAQRLAGLPGVVSAHTVLIPRDQLSPERAAETLARQGFRFPLLLRAPGFHGGEHFLKVDSLDALPDALDALPHAGSTHATYAGAPPDGDSLFVLSYLDARAADGKARKYRALTINGQLYPLHLAISNHWKVHYFSADMANNPLHRAEEARFLAEMSAVLGPRAMAALRLIQSTLALDYGGIDFGLSPDGEILVFEANATMAIVPPDANPIWNYRRAAIEQAQAALRQMFFDRALTAQGSQSPVQVPGSAVP